MCAAVSTTPQPEVAVHHTAANSAATRTSLPRRCGNSISAQHHSQQSWFTQLPCMLRGPRAVCCLDVGHRQACGAARQEAENMHVHGRTRKSKDSKRQSPIPETRPLAAVSSHPLQRITDYLCLPSPVAPVVQAPTAAQTPPPCARTRRQRLLQLLRLVVVGDAQGVEVARAADLELGHARGLLDLHRLGVLPTGCGHVHAPQTAIALPTMPAPFACRLRAAARWWRVLRRAPPRHAKLAHQSEGTP